MSERVLLADDHAVFRQGLRALLEKRGLEVVGDAADGQAAVELTQRLRPEAVPARLDPLAVGNRYHGVRSCQISAKLWGRCPARPGAPPAAPPGVRP